MSVSISITIKDQATPEVLRFIAGLNNRAPLNRMIGNRVKNSIREHLQRRSLQVRNKFGAPSSGFWAKAARNVATAPLEVGNEAVSISLEHPGIARAFGPVTIRPKAPRKFLAIPLNAAAYNRRAYRMSDLFARFKPGATKGVLSRRNKDGSIENMYALVPSVTQSQDRSILPSDAAIEAAALEGVQDYANKLLSASRS